MSTPQDARRRIAPASTMALAILGTLALLITFVVQVVTAAPPKLEPVPANVLALIERSFAPQEVIEDVGELRPETAVVLERADDGAIAFGFRTTNDSLGAGIFVPPGGGTTGVAPADKTRVWMDAMIRVDDTPHNYELTVRRTGPTYDHTFTAKQ
ncbi:MAG: hypothetical protein ACTH30_11880 [Leucobacter sp.]